jgi:NAD(P)-dependent dehydrogenase (short-subunit alcohol dehydrogenase family)
MGGHAHEDPISTFAPGLFAGRTALVTGGGTGIGHRIALGFARLGADVVIASRDPEHLDPAAEAIRAHGVKCLAVPTNIREVAEVDALLASVTSETDGLDFLVNNAGGQFPAPPSEISDNGWRAVVDLNLNGTWNMVKRFYPHMVERGFGTIVNIVHIYSFGRGAEPFVHSGAARAGVVNMTHTMAPYLAAHDVTINALAPGTVDTSGFHEKEAVALGLVGDRLDEMIEESAAQRMGTPDEVAAITLFLCSPAGRWINGSAIVADGAESQNNWPQFWPQDSSTPLDEA